MMVKQIYCQMLNQPAIGSIPTIWIRETSSQLEFFVPEAPLGAYTRTELRPRRIISGWLISSFLPHVRTIRNGRNGSATICSPTLPNAIIGRVPSKETQKRLGTQQNFVSMPAGLRQSNRVWPVYRRTFLDPFRHCIGF